MTEKKEITNPHDKFFKETLVSRENARSFLENYLPKEVLPLLELDTLEIEKDSFIQKELQEYFSDMLYKVTIHGEEAYVYILFEHKSYPDAWLSLQLLEYMVQCWKLKKEQKDKLPVIIPLVLYHGESPWPYSRKLSDLLGGKNPLLQKYIPDFEYELYDLTKYADEEIQGIPCLQAMMLLFKYIRSAQFEEKLVAILKILAREPNLEYLIAIAWYVFSAKEIDFKTFVQMVKTNVSSQGGEYIMTTAEKLIQQGRIEGEIKGKIEGKIEGEIKGEIKAIESVLEIKFGARGLSCMNTIRELHDLEKLSRILEFAKKDKSIDKFESSLQKVLQQG